jgi:hypothetical protein
MHCLIKSKLKRADTTFWYASTLESPDTLSRIPVCIRVSRTNWMYFYNSLWILTMICDFILNNNISQDFPFSVSIICRKKDSYSFFSVMNGFPILEVLVQAVPHTETDLNYKDGDKNRICATSLVMN